jgi:hypothetical protein
VLYADDEPARLARQFFVVIRPSPAAAPQDGDKGPRAEITLTAWDVSASMAFETLTTAKAARAGQGDGDPWAEGALPQEERANREVLAGVTASS